MHKFLLLLIALFAATPIHAGDIYYYFEDNNDPTMPTNSNQGEYSIRYVGETHQSTEQFKFGKGSMVIDEKKGPAGNPIGGFASLPSEFIDEIHKMTITTWIRPSTSGDFWIIQRMPNGAPGYFSLNYSVVYKCFFFGYTGNDSTQGLGARSNKINFIEPDEWVHIALTYDAGKIVFYVNGISAGEGDVTAQGSSSIPAVSGSSTLSGFTALTPGSYVDDFGFFPDRALSEADMDVIFNKGLESFVKASAPKTTPAPSASPAASPAPKK
ncbi:MAG: LamG domain-containing protein [Chthoniobacterales bacterium]